jgi:hypothetical protein
MSKKITAVQKENIQWVTLCKCQIMLNNLKFMFSAEFDM